MAKHARLDQIPDKRLARVSQLRRPLRREAGRSRASPGVGGRGPERPFDLAAELDAALGLIAGLSGAATWSAIGLTALIVGVIAIVDSPLVLRRSREQTLVLDRAYPDEDDARAAVETLLGTTVQRVTVRGLDLVSDTTTVNVRYALPRRGASPRRRSTHDSSTPSERDSAPDTVAHTWQVAR